MTNHFTFFASYYDSIEHLDNDTKAEFLDVLIRYALRDELPEAISPVVKALFTMAKPNLDQSKARRKAGAKGGKQTPSKPEAKRKQNASKPEAPLKQTPSDKEKEKDKDIKNITSDSRENRSPYTQEFESFWKEYPNKKGKHKAFMAWKRYKCGNGLFVEIMSSLEKQKNSVEWERDGGKYIPHGSTWVNGKMWEDETSVGCSDNFCSSCAKFCKPDSPDHCHQNGGAKACNSYSRKSK